MGRTAYRYPISFFLPVYGGMLASFVVLLIFGIYLTTKGRIDESYNYIGAFCVVLGFSALYSVFDIYVKHLSISTNAFEISNSFLGKPINRIGWDSIKVIERRRSFDAMWNKNRNIYYVIGSNNRIRFDESVKDLRRLLDEINANVRKYNIEIMSIDLGRDTRREIGLTVTDKTERRKLMRYGVHVSVTEL